MSSGTLTPRYAIQKENCDPSLAKKSITAPASPVSPATPAAGGRPEEGSSGPGRSPTQAPATGVAKPVPRLPTQQAPCTAEIKTIGAFPPLMRAVSWDTVGTLNSRNGAPPPGPGPGFSTGPEEVFTFPDKSRDGPSKQSGYKDFPAQPVATQKLSKLREVYWSCCFTFKMKSCFSAAPTFVVECVIYSMNEWESQNMCIYMQTFCAQEHKLLRNQSILGSTLPELSETSEHEKGTLPTPLLVLHAFHTSTSRWRNCKNMNTNRNSDSLTWCVRR